MNNEDRFYIISEMGFTKIFDRANNRVVYDSDIQELCMLLNKGHSYIKERDKDIKEILEQKNLLKHYKSEGII